MRDCMLRPAPQREVITKSNQSGGTSILGEKATRLRQSPLYEANDFNGFEVATSFRLKKVEKSRCCTL